MPDTSTHRHKERTLGSRIASLAEAGPLPTDFGSLQRCVMETNVNAPDRNTSTSASSGYASASRFRREGIKFFTIPEVAECLNVSTRTVRRWIERGELVVAHRFGAAVGIAEANLKALSCPTPRGLADALKAIP